MQSKARSARETTTIPVVGVGASAGGLEALRAFVQGIPDLSGIAWVVVQHLGPTDQSMLPELLAAHSAVPVRPIEDGTPLSADTVFVVQSGAMVTLTSDGRLRLEPRAGEQRSRNPIDRFFESIAREAGARAGCVVLSGTGSDGTVGLRAVKATGGLAIAQATHSARFAAMPENAIATNLVDFVLQPGAIAKRIVDTLNHRQHPLEGHRPPRSEDAVAGEAAVEVDDDAKSLHAEIERRMPDILRLVEPDGAHGFSAYKTGTLVRRTSRRVAARKAADLDAYLAILQADATERQDLIRDLLIGVTQFFRDPDAFEALRTVVAATLMGRDQRAFRIWIPGCSTGEEAYSIAMLFAEAKEAAGDVRTVQLFGTDIDLGALRQARQGIYQAKAIEAIGEARRRWFEPYGDQVIVHPALREMCVFAPQNLVQDPPFSRLDLISCRNVLIYLNAEAQAGVLPRLHFALNPSGYLVLGPSESLGRHESLFHTVDRTNRIFRRNDSILAAHTLLHPRSPVDRDPRLPRRGTTRPEDAVPKLIDTQAEQLFLRQFAAPFAVVNGRDEVVYVSEQMSRFVRPSKGAPSASIDMFLMRELRLPVRGALADARRALSEATVENIIVETDGRRSAIDIVASPVDPDANLIMVVVRSVRMQDAQEVQEFASARSEADRELVERELAQTRQQLVVTLSEHDTIEQELKSANEELLSMNEELQSANEELQVSRGELQSANEQLATMNVDLIGNNRQLGQANSDLKNLFEETAISILFLDGANCVRMFTPELAKLFGIRERDVGRPIGDLAARVDYCGLADDTAEVARTRQPITREVRVRATDETFQVTVRPYRTLDYRLEGCVLTFFDISSRKRDIAILEAQTRTLREQNAELQTLYDRMPLGFCLVDREFRFLRINEALAELNSLPVSAHIGRTIDELFPERAEASKARFQKVFDLGWPLTDVEIVTSATRSRPGVERTWIADYFPIFNGREVFAVGACAREVTESLKLRRQIEAEQQRLRRVLDNVSAFIFQLTPEGIVLDANQLALARGGIGRADVIGKPVWETVWWRHHPTMQERITDAVRRAASGETVRTDAELMTSGSGLAVVDLEVVPTRDPTGRVNELFCSAMDVSDRRNAEAHKETLLYELQNRVNNTLATVMAIMRFSARTAASNDELVTSFGNRISAISRSHDALIAGGWEGERLAALIAREMRPFGHEGDARFTYRGADPLLSPKQSLALALGVHELAANATRHGALSVVGGTVTIEVDQERSDKPATIVWRERGGPPRGSSSERDEGFGFFLLRQVLGRELDGQVSLDFGIGEFVCRITFGGSDDLKGEREMAASETQILIVEDEALIGFDLADLLSDAGYQIKGPYATADAALEALVGSDLSLAILDVNLGDGRTSQRIAERLTREGTPILFVSGYTTSGSEVLRNFPNAQRLTKPWDPQELLSLIRSYLSVDRSALSLVG